MELPLHAIQRATSLNDQRRSTQQQLTSPPTLETSQQCQAFHGAARGKCIVVGCATSPMLAVTRRVRSARRGRSTRARGGNSDDRQKPSKLGAEVEHRLSKRHTGQISGCRWPCVARRSPAPGPLCLSLVGCWPRVGSTADHQSSPDALRNSSTAQQLNSGLPPTVSEE